MEKISFYLEQTFNGVILLFLISAGYIINYYFVGYIDHIVAKYVVFGALSVWFCYLYLANRDFRVLNRYDNKKNWQYLLLFGVYYLLLLLIFLCGTILVIYGNLNSNPPASRLYIMGYSMSLNNLLYLNWLLLTMAVSCLLLFIRYQVQDANIVIINNRVYFPGEDFWVFPFRFYSINICGIEIELSYEKIEICCLQRVICLDMTTAIYFDISTAREHRIRQLDYERFVKKVKEKILKLIIEDAEHQSIEELVTQKMIPFNDYAVGFPFYWKGVVTFGSIKNSG